MKVPSKAIAKAISVAVVVTILLGTLVGGAIWLSTSNRAGLDPQGSDPDAPSLVGLDLGRLLGGTPPEGFQRVLGPRPFVFPEDHGPHPEYRSEWWYFTGNLQTTDGRDFGYQLTLFRSALAPEPSAKLERPASLEETARTSAWATRQVYMGHFALTDVDGGRFHAFQRLARGAAGLAGAHAEPFEVWVGPWRMESVGDDFWPLRLRAGEGVGIDLVVEPTKERILQGDQGYSRKGAEEGNASHYYSYTRLGTEGTVRVGPQGQERKLEVRGTSWLDREWSTSALGAGQVGWDWFALQLEDGSELMLYSLRRGDGTVDPASAGTFVGADGSVRKLRAGDFSITVLDRWRSPDGAATYPARWTLAVPSEALEVEVQPRLENQELLLVVRYWEGSVEVSGRRGDRPVAGVGYVELTGYAPSS